ncbi:hypothetical protein HDV05_001074 [Chytridiales sp. JEL 0842]|nr:hypothetical protein HDV05_001074 [Chytridiales sp. JEL 0842]
MNADPALPAPPPPPSHRRSSINITDTVVAFLKLVWLSYTTSRLVQPSSENLSISTQISLLAWSSASWAVFTSLLQHLMGHLKLPMKLLVEDLVQGANFEENVRVTILTSILQTTFLLSAFNELTHLFLSYPYLRPRVTSIRGTPISPTSSTSELECSICLNVGLGPAPPDTKKPPLVVDQPKQDNPLESFCSSPHHPTHRLCMYTWLRTPGSTLKCPTCRQKLIVHLVKEDKYSPQTIMQFLRGRLSGRGVGGRWGVCVGVALGVWGFWEAGMKIEKQRRRGRGAGGGGGGGSITPGAILGGLEADLGPVTGGGAASSAAAGALSIAATLSSVAANTASATLSAASLMSAYASSGGGR